MQGPALGGMNVRWQGEVQTLLPLVQAVAYLDVHWLVVEAHDVEVHSEEEDHEDLVEGGRGQVLEVCKLQAVAGGQGGVQEGEAGHGDQGEVLGPYGRVSP